MLLFLSIAGLPSSPAHCRSGDDPARTARAGPARERVSASVSTGSTASLCRAISRGHSSGSRTEHAQSRATRAGSPRREHRRRGHGAAAQPALLQDGVHRRMQTATDRAGADIYAL